MKYVLQLQHTATTFPVSSNRGLAVLVRVQCMQPEAQVHAKACGKSRAGDISGVACAAVNETSTGRDGITNTSSCS